MKRFKIYITALLVSFGLFAQVQQSRVSVGSSGGAVSGGNVTGFVSSQPMLGATNGGTITGGVGFFPSSTFVDPDCTPEIPTAGTWTATADINAFGVGTSTNENVTITLIGKNLFEISDIASGFYQLFNFDPHAASVSYSCDVLTFEQCTSCQFGVSGNGEGSYDPQTQTIMMPWQDATNGIATVTTFTYNGDPDPDPVGEIVFDVPYDIGSITEDLVYNITVSDPINEVATDILFSEHGNKMVIGVASSLGTGYLEQFSLSTPFDLSGGVTSDGAVTGFSAGERINFNHDGTKLYTLFGGVINQYSLTVPYDITSGLSLDGTSASLGVSAPTSVNFNEDGSRMLVGTDGVGGRLYSFDLTVNFDVTQSFSQSATVSTIASSDLVLNKTGTRAYAFYNNSVSEYALDGPYELYSGFRTAVASASLVVAASGSRGIAFDTAGTKLYFVDRLTNTVTQWSLEAPGFYESVADDGSVEGSLPVFVTGTPTFSLNTSDTDQITINNLPAGLTASTSLFTPTKMNITLTGNAINNLNVNSITDLNITFPDVVFENATAQEVTNSQNASSGFGLFFEGNCDVVSTPTNLVTSDIQEDQVTISWDAAANSSTYEVQYKVSGGPAWTTQNASSNTLTLMGLQPATTYVYRVRAVCGSTASGYSAIQSVTTNAINCEQVVITNSTPSENSIDLTWDAVASASSYEVQYKISGSAEAWTSANVTATTTTITGLTSSTNYVVRVRAICSGVSGTFSVIQSVTTTTISCEQVVITNSTPSENSIDLTWDAVASADSYEVQYKISGSADPWTSTNVSATTTTISGLTSSTNYVVRVRAICSGVSGTFSTIESVSTTTISCEQVVIASATPSDNSIDLSWNAVASADSYEVQYKISGSADPWTSTNVSAITTTISGLTSSTNYVVRVRAVCSGVSGTFSVIQSVTTTTLSCEQVVIASATPAENSIDLSWNAVGSATNYEVQYKVSGGPSWTSVFEAGTSVTISGLTSSTNYVVRVRAICSSLSGIFSTIQSVTTNAISCEQVVIASATPSENSIDLLWNAVGSASSYEVQYKVSGSATWSTIIEAGTSTTISGLSTSTDYVIRVRAICSGVSGTFSVIQSVTTATLSCEQVVIASATPSENSIDLSWNAVGSATNYEVQYKVSGSASWTSMLEAGTSITISGLSESTNYVVRVRAICSGVSGTFSVVESVTTDALSCEQVVITSSSSSDDSIDLSWNAVGSASNYEVQYKVSGGPTWTSVIEAGTSTTISGLSASTSYVIRIRAICSGVSGTFSAIESVTTDALSCEQVVITSATPSDDSIDLIWDVVGSANDYQIQYKLSGTPAWTTVSVATAFTTLTGLTSSSTYVIRIRARCSGIPGSFSAIEVVMTTAPATQIADGASTDQEVRSEEVLAEVQIPSLQLYPNPASGAYVYVSFSKRIETLNVRLTSLDGRTMDQQVEEGLNGHLKIDVSGLQNGIYFLEVVTQEHIFLEKILIQK